jgi:dienelactone hydrolase
MVDALIKHPKVDPSRVVLVGRSFGGLIAPRGASGEHRLAAMIVDPGQLEMGSAVMSRLGDLGQHLDDPAADAQLTRCSPSRPCGRSWPPGWPPTA